MLIKSEIETKWSFLEFSGSEKNRDFKVFYLYFYFPKSEILVGGINFLGSRKSTFFLAIEFLGSQKNRSFPHFSKFFLIVYYFLKSFLFTYIFECRDGLKPQFDLWVGYLGPRRALGGGR